MSDVFQVLKVDHEAIETVLRRLETARPPAGADPEWLLGRETLVERVIMEATKHETVEQEFFWPAVREHVEDGDALADEATAQEQQAKSSTEWPPATSGSRNCWPRSSGRPARIWSSRRHGCGPGSAGHSRVHRPPNWAPH